MDTITQSTLKAFLLVKDQKKCGLQFKAKYIDKTYPDEPSDAMRLGHFFEFLATGALPHYTGEEPEPEVISKGKPNERLSSTYQAANDQAIRFKELCKQMKMEVLEVAGTSIEGVVQAHWDIKVLYKKQETIVDLKYSGLLENKWEEFGWAKDRLEEKQLHAIQARHYRYATGLPFYFWVFSSGKNPTNRLINVRFTPESLNKHYQICEEARNSIKAIERAQFWPTRGNYTECEGCAIKEGCEARQRTPDVERVTFNDYPNHYYK